MNEPKAYSRFTLRQPARTYAQLLAQLKSKAFKRPPRRDGELKAFMAFVASVRDSVTDRKALRLPGDTSSFWRPLITNNGDEKMAWAIHKRTAQRKINSKLPALQAENGAIRREVWRLKAECEELERQIAALDGEHSC